MTPVLPVAAVYYKFFAQVRNINEIFQRLVYRPEPDLFPDIVNHLPHIACIFNPKGIAFNAVGFQNDLHISCSIQAVTVVINVTVTSRMCTVGLTL